MTSDSEEKINSIRKVISDKKIYWYDLRTNANNLQEQLNRINQTLSKIDKEIINYQQQIQTMQGKSTCSKVEEAPLK